MEFMLELADELERLIERDALWDGGELERLTARLAAARDEAALLGELVHIFDALRLRLAMGPVPDRLRRDVEAVVYPRLWKVVEAVRAELPVGEQRVRIQVLNRRLARLFVDEDPHAPAG